MRAVALSAIFLAGCSTVQTLEPYAPAHEIADQARYKSDEDTCRGYALAYHKGLSPTAIGSQAIQGAGQNLAGAAVNPLVPVIGAAGSGGAELANELGLTDTAQVKVFVTCLKVKTQKDGSALVLEPE